MSNVPSVVLVFFDPMGKGSNQYIAYWDLDEAKEAIVHYFEHSEGDPMFLSIYVDPEHGEYYARELQDVFWKYTNWRPSVYAIDPRVLYNVKHYNP